ncbi:MAG: sensory histidine kinase CreC [candidate division WS6 bacterium OLB20]|uniref:histidine kinase n=1 Tax=candidate division WS6 bacterium OLB20 TaxID=1617426 RepID=A0A136M048_9BACT|nr:MAG: sensory histidine kinase CreC [candidate division WS6 bacterium OLB20]
MLADADLDILAAERAREIYRASADHVTHRVMENFQHDFRTPLTIVNSSAYLLSRSIQMAERDNGLVINPEQMVANTEAAERIEAGVSRLNSFSLLYTETHPLFNVDAENEVITRAMNDPQTRSILVSEVFSDLQRGFAVIDTDGGLAADRTFMTLAGKSDVQTAYEQAVGDFQHTALDRQRMVLRSENGESTGYLLTLTKTEDGKMIAMLLPESAERAGEGGPVQNHMSEYVAASIATAVFTEDLYTFQFELSVNDTAAMRTQRSGILPADSNYPEAVAAEKQRLVKLFNDEKADRLHSLREVAQLISAMEKDFFGMATYDVQRAKEKVQTATMKLGVLRNTINKYLRFADAYWNRTAEAGSVALRDLVEEMSAGCTGVSDEFKVHASADEGVEISASKDDIVAMVTELAENAQQVLDGAAPNHELALTVDHDEEYVYITVSDNGMSLSTDQLSHILFATYDVDQAGGSLRPGLGLNIVRALARRNGIRLDVSADESYKYFTLILAR